jgi:Tol biopolymer transport system component
MASIPRAGRCKGTGTRTWKMVGRALALAYTTDMLRVIAILSCVLAACTHAASPPPNTPSAPASAAHPTEEWRLSQLTQLTFGGENAEAYFSFDGQRVSLQRRTEDMGCDRIYTMPIFQDGKPVVGADPLQISSGQGATTCSHFYPDGEHLLYASTHLAGPECPPKPDMSQGYVWAIYDSYDIFKAKSDGSEVTRLTETPGYDAEGTVCAKDGSVVFTSVRDGDIELYRMDADGKNVKRLTSEPGYDGGAFFNAECSKIVWRASRPKPGPELDNYRALLQKGLVRPTKLELYVANGDGSEPRQVTYLDSASFAPFWYPKRERIIFSSNYGDPQGREFDLWAINADGTELERITFTPGFDGFPMFTPDGQHLIFASNRATAPGAHDTNLFLARFASEPSAPYAPQPKTAAAERIRGDATWLADPAREGRGIGTRGLESSGAYIEARLRELGATPLGAAGDYRLPFQVTTELKRTAATQLTVGAQAQPASAFATPGYSSEGSVSGQAVLAGYAMVDEQLGVDDFKGLDVTGKIAVARRFAPELPALDTPAAQRSAGDLRKKAFQAKAHGAKALVVVDWPVTAAESGQAATALPNEAALPELHPAGSGDAGIPVVVVKREALSAVWSQLESKKAVPVSISVGFERKSETAFNVVGRIEPSSASAAQQAPIIVGAHYDHLGYGGRDSLAPDQHAPHLGADDNASGVATVLEIARVLSETQKTLTQPVIIALFSGEESGVLGSAAMVASQPAWLSQARAMINLDMVGRLRGNTLTVLGSQTASEWPALLERACADAHIRCIGSGDGYGPSDQISFYTAGLPVLHMFTGAHSDYHKPSDTAAQLNAGGMAKVAEVVTSLVRQTESVKLAYQKIAAPAGAGDARSWNASLGTVPDYAGPPRGVSGVLIADVRPGGGANLAGIRRGDVLVRLGKFSIGSVEDLMFVLMQARPGETVTAKVLREGKELPLSATFQEGRRR